MRTSYISLRGSLAVGLGIGLVYCAWAWPALAHTATPTASQPLGWQYGWECCSTIDCKDLPKGEIKATPVGWRVESTGEVIPYGDKRIKQSKDERFHRCARGGDFSLPTSLCLYVPDMGF